MTYNGATRRCLLFSSATLLKRELQNPKNINPFTARDGFSLNVLENLLYFIIAFTLIIISSFKEKCKKIIYLFLYLFEKHQQLRLSLYMPMHQVYELYLLGVELESGLKQSIS